MILAHVHTGTRALINGIREDLSFLNAEIGFLKLSIDDLQAEADILVGIEQDLGNIATTQGTNVEEIVQLVNENEEILALMKSNLTQTFFSAMVKIVLRSDSTLLASICNMYSQKLFSTLS